MARFLAILPLLAASAALLIPAAFAETPLLVTPITEKKVATLPAGDLFWCIETFSSVAQAQAVAGKWGLVAQSAGKIWLFTLGPPGRSSPGGTKIADVGPIARVAAPEYLLRINDATGPPGSKTPVHSHPGSEAFFVLTGEQSIRMPDGIMRVKAGQPEAGHGADMAMQVESSGTTDLHALVMFAVDATKPFSIPAAFP
jgi:mannose-6-phosphate isomerase-like protein (cupin superfamily)